MICLFGTGWTALKAKNGARAKVIYLEATMQNLITGGIFGNPAQT